MRGDGDEEAEQGEGLRAPKAGLWRSRCKARQPGVVDVFDCVIGWLASCGYYALRVDHEEALKRTLEEAASLVKSEIESFLAVRMQARDRYLAILQLVSTSMRWSDVNGVLREEFQRLRGTREELYEYQLLALKHLADYGVPAHPAVMLSFSTQESHRSLLERLREIDPKYVREFEEEYVFLYPHVVENLRKAGLSPRVAYSPNEIPDELV